MAENEILDVGSPRRYWKWRSALCDLEQSPEQVAGFLEEEFISVTRKCLQGQSLSLVLKACGEDRAAMRAAIESCKNKDLARYAEQAYRATASKDINVLADHIAGALIDRLQDRARLFAFKQPESVGKERLRAVEEATAARLNVCKSEIISLLAASLRDEKLPRRRVREKHVRLPRAIAGQSLLVPAHRWGQGASDHV